MSTITIKAAKDVDHHHEQAIAALFATVHPDDKKTLTGLFSRPLTITDSGCWRTGYADHGKGYVTKYHTVTGKMVRAHRLTFAAFNELAVIDLPTVTDDGQALHLDHLCRNRACVNPEHLELVTAKENVNRGLLGSPDTHPQSIKTHCPRGHSLAGDNLKPSGIRRGDRDCLLCARANTRASNQGFPFEDALQWIETRYIGSPEWLDAHEMTSTPIAA